MRKEEKARYKKKRNFRAKPYTKEQLKENKDKQFSHKFRQEKVREGKEQLFQKEKTPRRLPKLTLRNQAVQRLCG